MRKQPSLVLSAVAVTACVWSVAYAVTLPPALQARYTGLIAALKKGDMKAYETFYAPEYVSVDPSGKTSNRADSMIAVQGLLKGAKKMTFHIKYTGVKIQGDVAEVSFDCIGQIFKPEGTTSFHEVGTDSWKKKGKVWMETKTVDKVFTVTAPKPAGK